MHWLCLTRTCLLFLQNQHVMGMFHGGKFYVASYSYFPTILRHNLSVWFLKGSHRLLNKFIFKNLSSHCWQEWIEFCLCNIERRTYVKKKMILSNPHCCCTQQNLTPVHSNTGLEHIMHIVLYLICISWKYIVWNLPVLWREKQTFLLPDLWKWCKLLKICCIEFPVHFVLSIVCQNFLPFCQFHSNRLWSVGTDGYVNIFPISPCSTRKSCKTELLLPSGVEVGLIVCVQFVLKLPGIQIFQIQ